MNIGSPFRVLRQNVRTMAIRTCLAGRLGEQDACIISSSPRSGSTLFARALGTDPDTCVLFEPLNTRRIPQASKVGFIWQTDIDPAQDWLEGEEYLRRVFSGRVVNHWTSREMTIHDACRSSKMIVKCIRSNPLLPWICRAFDIPSPILLIRHPCAVIASQIRTGWFREERPPVPRWLETYPLFISTLSRTEGVYENLAASWALDHLPPLLREAPRPWSIFTYEDLILNPRETITDAFQLWGLKGDPEAAMASLDRPSSVVYEGHISGLDGWREQLTEEQISAILETLESFGLRFYSRNIEADHSLLRDVELSEKIRAHGRGL